MSVMIVGQSPVVKAGLEKTPILNAACRSTAAISSVLFALHGIPLQKSLSGVLRR